MKRIGRPLCYYCYQNITPWTMQGSAQAITSTFRNIYMYATLACDNIEKGQL